MASEVGLRRGGLDLTFYESESYVTNVTYVLFYSQFPPLYGRHNTITLQGMALEKKCV